MSDPKVFGLGSVAYETLTATSPAGRVEAATAVMRLETELDALKAENAELTKAKDGAYSERNKCVALLAGMALRLGMQAGIGRHVGDNWEDDWRNIVFVELPTGQVTWHIHDSELPQFDFLPRKQVTWDGHDTDEKYRRVLAAARRALGEAE